jgi:hypothetical protein
VSVTVPATPITPCHRRRRSPWRDLSCPTLSEIFHRCRISSSAGRNFGHTALPIVRRIWCSPGRGGPTHLPDRKAIAMGVVLFVLLTIVWIASMGIGQYIGLKKGYVLTGFLAGLCLSFIGVILMAKIGPPTRVVREQRRRQAVDRQQETNRLLRQIADQSPRHGAPLRQRSAAAPDAPARQAGHEDADLAQLRRAVALAEAQPAGDLGKALTPAQVIAESRQMRSQVAAGQLQSVWGRRLELGSGVSAQGVPQSDWFWLNAAPALAALRLGLKDHPMVAMCCGVAEQARNRDDAEQSAAVAEFNRLFFLG